MATKNAVGNSLTGSTGSGAFVGATSPTLITPVLGLPTDCKLIRQRVYTQTSAVSTGTTTLPFDDTIPQNTEGNEFMTLAITPTNASNILEIKVSMFIASSVAAANNVSMALFQDSTANALSATATTVSAANYVVNFSMTHTMVAGTTSATTFKVRAGSQAAGTVTFNGQVSARIFGGVAASNIIITEYAV